MSDTPAMPVIGLDLQPAPDDHGRVLAVLEYLRSADGWPPA